MTNAKILVVEDEYIVAKDIQSRLKKLGYDVPFIASSGLEAIERITELYPDLVLMDVQIKGDIDGVETARQIHNCYSVPVVYLTAYSDDSTLARAKLTDPSGYLLKPFKERELYTAVEIALSKYRMEQQLKESEKWLTTVLKSIGDAVIASDINKRIIFMNPVAEVLTEWKQVDVLGRDVEEVFHIVNEETGSSVESPIIRALKLRTVVNLPEHTILIARNGTEIPIDDSAAPIQDEQGNITGAVLVFRDITERKQAEEARQKQTVQELLVAELERLNQLKDEFLNTVSHELRTPMTNMRMAIQMLQVSSTVEQLQCYLEILQSECNREIDLINNILDLQRLEVLSCKLFCAESINIHNWLPDLIQPFKSRANERQQILQLHLLANLPPILTDRTSLERILLELLNNACKYTVDGGEIILSVSHAYQHSISQSGALPSDMPDGT
ncbi:MAG: response regulator, partial [Chroococcidiopsidaceae cyanobacterium CP_BM_ER_R8_30]|nr:response regulator [Chroococcidiopsidaceae cyanobacterium CP_BM_ER_R8_30]